MAANNAVPLQELLEFALPTGTELLAGPSDTLINWAITIRAQPPAFPEIYGGELVLLSMELLRSYNNRMTLGEVVVSLADAGVQAIAVRGDVPESACTLANQHGVSLLMLAEDTNLTRIERSINMQIVNQSAQYAQRAIEVQRQLTRMVAENRDLNSLLQILARAMNKPVLVHDANGEVMAQVNAASVRRGNDRMLAPSLPYGVFQNWLVRDAPVQDGRIVPSPLGFTTVLKVEKRIAGYLSVVSKADMLDDFDRLVMSYGADVCAIELAKNRAIAFAVEQTRGDWVQMWLSGTPTEDGMMAMRAQQAGFDPDSVCLIGVFEVSDSADVPLEALAAMVRDEMARQQLPGAVGRYVDAIVALYPIAEGSSSAEVRQTIEELRQHLNARVPDNTVSVGIGRPAAGLVALRGAYREARDALNIAAQLGAEGQSTFYGDLKLYQLLLGLQEHNANQMAQFCSGLLDPLLEYEDRRQGDFLRTLHVFFESNGNLARAAQELDVHRNTLVYRLERISELLDLDLDDADNRLVLYLALKIRRVLAATLAREKKNGTFR